MGPKRHITGFMAIITSQAIPTLPMTIPGEDRTRPSCGGATPISKRVWGGYVGLKK